MQRRRFSTLLLLVLVGLLGLALIRHQDLYDWYRLHNYQPTAAVSNLATGSSMTDYGRRIYYVNHPMIDQKSVFASNCPSGTEQTVVLGCYKGNQAGIYFLSIDNGELAGIMQVTAAHEMLHAGFDRLSAGDKTRVSNLLQNYYDHDLHDATIKQTIDEYRKTEPNALVDEMHSIFGTEVANLPAPLESYYKKYFNDRSKVVNYYNGYEAAFTSRQAKIKAYDQQLSDWKTQITALEQQISSDQTALSRQRQQLEAQRSSNDIAGYNQGVSSYNAAVNHYNSEISRLKTLITNYNQLVTQRNAIAFEEQALVKSLTSSQTTVQ